MFLVVKEDLEVLNWFFYWVLCFIIYVFEFFILFYKGYFCVMVYVFCVLELYLFE